MWHPPIALTLEEQNRAARTRTTRKCLVWLRASRQARLDAAGPHPRAQSASPEPTGTAPVEGGRWALALR